MRKFTRSLLTRLTIAFAIVLAVFAAPVSSSAFHDVVATDHAVTADADDNDHSYDFDEPSDEVEAWPSLGAGHHHTHNSGDHSHEKLGTPPTIGALSVVSMASRLIASCDPKVRSLSSSFLRPPRPSDIV